MTPIDHEAAQVWAASTLLGSAHTGVEQLKNVARCLDDLHAKVERLERVREAAEGSEFGCVSPLCLPMIDVPKAVTFTNCGKCQNCKFLQALTAWRSRCKG